MDVDVDIDVKIDYVSLWPKPRCCTVYHTAYFHAGNLELHRVPLVTSKAHMLGVYRQAASRTASLDGLFLGTGAGVVEVDLVLVKTLSRPLTGPDTAWNTTLRLVVALADAPLRRHQNDDHVYLLSQYDAASFGSRAQGRHAEFSAACRSETWCQVIPKG